MLPGGTALQAAPPRVDPRAITADGRPPPVGQSDLVLLQDLSTEL